MTAKTRGTIRFLLNEEVVELSEVRPEETLLDFLRLRRSLRGTKEGCAEGDCGACTVLVGRLAGDGLVYEGVTACIRFLASLDACHVVTVEHLAAGREGLHPVQQALVDHHGSQCGFCTPGFVMSLYALWMREPSPSEEAVEKALQGNLCRCTGYDSIVKAAVSAADHGTPEADPLVAEREAVIEQLTAMRDGRRIEIGSGAGRVVVPASTDDLADLLAETPEATIVAGATDVGLWVTKFMRDIGPAVFIGGLEDLRSVDETDRSIGFGAGVSYSEALGILSRRIPPLGRLVERIGGDQIRNMGTIGGNIANGSPIGDMPPPLIALGAEIVLRHGTKRRTLALEDFFIDYGKQDRAPGEFVESVLVPLPAEKARFGVYKVSKRRDEDITAVLGAFHLRLDADGTVTEARIAYGGMAATPRRAKAVEAALNGRSWTIGTVEAAMDTYQDDFEPISDMRASAEYRMAVARNLLKRFFLETSGGAPVTVSRHEAA